MNKKVNFEKISAYRRPEESPGYLLWYVSMQWRRAIEKTLKRYKLTHPQFVILATIAWILTKTSLASQVEISHAAGLDPNTISQIIRSLEAKKLIKRVQKKDDRSKNPELTALGRAVLKKALPAVEKADAQFFAPLNSIELGQLISLFQELIVR